MRNVSIKNRENSLFIVFSWIAALGLFCLGMWQFHNTEFYSHFGLVPGGRGDPRLVTALMEYFHHSLHGPGSLVSPAFYYPAKGCMGYADVFLSYALFYDWLRNGGWDVFTSLQICVFVTDILNYLCCFLFLWRGLRQGVLASALGSFFFAYNAPKFNQISHVQLQCLFWFPLVLWCLVEWAGKRRGMKPSHAFGWLSLAGLLFNLQLYSAFYVSWFFVFWSFLFLLLAFLFSPTREFLWNLVRCYRFPLMGGGGVTLAGLIPFLIIYLPVIRNFGGKNYSEILMMLPDAHSFLWMGPRHAWWGWLWDKCPAIQAYPVEGEVRMGFGLVVLIAWAVLTALAVKSIRKKGSMRADFLPQGLPLQFTALVVLATTLFYLLAFQFPGGHSLWHLVYYLFPGGQSIRAVSRCAVFLALPMAIAFTIVFQAGLNKVMALKDGSSRWLGLLILLFPAGLMAYEQTAFPPTPAFDKMWELNRLEYLSQKIPAGTKAFYAALAPGLPYSATDIQIDAMMLSSVRGIPTLNGYSGENPSQWQLYVVRSPKYEEHVQEWIKLKGIQEPVFRLEIDH
ncbi:MAG TPA: hypothetical protein VMV05_11625 [bacterium]|nr:hypothetical protein [bacterium]